jgi:hypothetical protein
LSAQHGENPEEDGRDDQSAIANQLSEPEEQGSNGSQRSVDLLGIVALTKKEKIRLMIKEHVTIWKQFETKKKSGITNELKTIIHQAQESQKSLQKLITKDKVKGYVKGWNPWDAKRELFPPPPKKEGKKRSSTSKRAQQYDDPRVWVLSYPYRIHCMLVC